MPKRSLLLHGHLCGCLAIRSSAWGVLNISLWFIFKVILLTPYCFICHLAHHNSLLLSETRAFVLWVSKLPDQIGAQYLRCVWMTSSCRKDFYSLRLKDIFARILLSSRFMLGQGGISPRCITGRCPSARQSCDEACVQGAKMRHQKHTAVWVGELRAYGVLGWGGGGVVWCFFEKRAKTCHIVVPPKKCG
jgi:hypothetical protein